jgi:predicted TIM-barrel fold metal-dependent hydrolase
MIVDVAAFVGPYPFRHLSDASPDWLAAQMDRLGVEEAWIGYLPSFLYRDPAPGNATLLELVGHDPRFRPVPAVHPGLPNWKAELAVVSRRAPAVRVYPNYWQLDVGGADMGRVVDAVVELELPLLLTVRFEDLRQRHHLDSVPDLSPATVRALVRRNARVRLIVTHADRAFIEEVHFGLTPTEAARVRWDFSWIWGPPEDHLRHLVDTLGADRFLFGSGMPLRIPDAVIAKLDLLDLSADERSAIEQRNAREWARAC